MANFYTDNGDIQFLFRHYNLGELAGVMEDDFSASKDYEWAPGDAAEAWENYGNVLDIIGKVSGDFIAPRAEGIDQEGNVLNKDGSVTRAAGMQENIDILSKAQVMGFTLPHRFGGLNFPNLVYTISNEIVSRADAALMNIYGLQGIAETINAFASEEIKQKYLPGFCEGKFTGAMVLTEPDAGSDLQAVKLRAYEDAEGEWLLHGVKRFITNGCGEVLLVLARSETDRSGGLGLSLFVCKPGPTVKVRRLENKLGIHGSPTCEIFFDHTPCELIGERQRGLVTYVMSLMNGARVGIAAQSIGIGEAAYREARDYAVSRKQFGVAIETFPAVRDLLIEMQMDVEVARTLTYETCWWVDMEYGAMRKLADGEVTDKVQRKELKQQEKKCKRITGMLTPMSKYYASEMCNRVAYDAIQVLGGSGYMKDYPTERYARDARITTIYEGTSQLQIIAAVRGVCGGAADRLLSEMEEFEYPQEVSDLVELLKQGHGELLEAVVFVKERPDTDYMDLHGRKLVDAAIMLIVGHLFLQQSVAEAVLVDDYQEKYREIQKHKGAVARRYIGSNTGKISMLCQEIKRGDQTTLTSHEDLLMVLEK